MAQFAPMERLETTNLVVRPFTMGDLGAVHRLLDLELDWAGSLEEREDWLRFCIRLAENWRNPPLGYRAISLKSTNEVIGKCGFFCYVLTSDEQSLFGSLGVVPPRVFNSVVLGVGYGLSGAHRGRGYATEAVRALIGYGFQELSLDALWARTTHDNMRSRALMERVGMATGENPDRTAWPGVVGVIRNTG